MPASLPLPRVIVTGHTDEGRSTFISDGAPHRVRTVEERPGYRVSNLWALFDSPAAINDPDRVAEVAGLAPPPRGSLIRIIDDAHVHRTTSMRHSNQELKHSHG